MGANLIFQPPLLRFNDEGIFECYSFKIAANGLVYQAQIGITIWFYKVFCQGSAAGSLKLNERFDIIWFSCRYEGLKSSY